MELQQRDQEHFDDFDIFDISQQQQLQLAQSSEIIDDEGVYRTDDGRLGEVLDSDALSNTSSVSNSLAKDQNWVIETETESVTSSESRHPAPTWRPRQIKIQRTGRDTFWSIGLDSLPFDPKPKVSLLNPGTKLQDEFSGDVHSFYVEIESNERDRRKRRYFVRWPEEGEGFLFLEEYQANSRMFSNGRRENRRFLLKRSEKAGGFLLESTDRNRFVGVDTERELVVAVIGSENAVKWTIHPDAHTDSGFN